MILCHCNVLTDKDAQVAIARMQMGSGAAVTPSRIHKHLGARPSCGKCFRHMACLIREAAGEGETAPVQERLAAAE